MPGSLSAKENFEANSDGDRASDKLEKVADGVISHLMDGDSSELPNTRCAAFDNNASHCCSQGKNESDGSVDHINDNGLDTAAHGVAHSANARLHDITLRKHGADRRLCLALDERVRRASGQRRVVVSALPRVQEAIPGPAEQAGMQVGDEILAIGGRDVCGARLHSVIELLQTSPGSVVIRVARRQPQPED